MNTLQIQDSFEPYYDGRKNALCARRPACRRQGESKPRTASTKPARPKDTDDAREARARADSSYRARSATTASSTIMPLGVARRRELPICSTSPSSCRTDRRGG